MKLELIKETLKEGKIVYWKTKKYVVTPNCEGILNVITNKVFPFPPEIGPNFFCDYDFFTTDAEVRVVWTANHSTYGVCYCKENEVNIVVSRLLEPHSRWDNWETFGTVGDSITVEYVVEAEDDDSNYEGCNYDM